MTAQEFKKRLEQHDWFYYFSDDPRVYHSGEYNSKELYAIASSNNDEFKRIYNEIHERMFNTPSFTSPDRPYVKPFNV